MTPDQLVGWAVPGALTAFAVVLWYLARKLWTRLDHQDDNIKRIDAMLAMELRGLDVRLSIVEAQLNLSRK